MAEQKISTYLAYTLIFAAFMFGIGALIGEINEEYGLSSDTSFQSTFGATENLTSVQPGLSAFLNDSAEDPNAVSFILNSFGTPIRLIAASFNFFATLIGDLVEEVPMLSGYGEILGEVIMTIFIVGMVLLIISAVFRWRLA